MPTTKSNSQSTTQAVIVCVALFFLFLVLTRNYLPLKALPRTIPLANYSVCRTSACLEYSKHLQRSLSTKANPCYNFYRFVCDSRSDLHPPEYDTLLTLTSERLKMHILRTWVEGSADAIIGDRVGETTLRAGSLLRSCVSGSRLSSYSSDRMSELRALMDERGLTWPHAPQSTPSAEDLLDVLVDWTLNWNVDVWFSLRVFLIDKVDRRVLFRISRSEILRRWPKERAVLDGAGEYIAFVNAHAREFGAKSSDEIDRAVHDVLEAEQEIESFFADYETDSVLAMRDSKAKETEAEAERWRNAVRRSLGPSAYNATKQSIVFVSSQGLFAAVAILLSRGAKKEKYYSAIGWTVAREIGRLVSGSLRALHRMAGMELTLWCWNRMDKVTRSVLVEPFYESTLLRREMATVTQLFRSLRGTLSLAVTKNSWMDERTKEVTFSKIAAVSLGFGSSGSFAPHAPRSRQSRSDGNETLFAAWKRAFSVYQKHGLVAIRSSYQTLLQCKKDCIYCRRVYNKRVQCLRDFHRQESVSFGHAFGRHNHTDWFCDFAAVPHLYNVVFGPRAEPRHSRERLAGLEELSPEQLFFVGLCSTLCSRRDPDGDTSPAEARCNVPLMHMPQFERAFQCPAGLPMTPAARCSFW
ncbi:hypothetical protein V5799_021232 [Amblyomma americanum]|uniref:M13 family peptidase n=1 Tax=Amblyomma americanum TaxID=6943 RepID=A0AAQ4FP23_AMBAM